MNGRGWAHGPGAGALVPRSISPRRSRRRSDVAHRRHDPVRRRQRGPVPGAWDPRGLRHARDLLHQQRVHRRRPTHLTWTQLTELAADGNEIASHTMFHTNMKKLKTGPARQAVCGDRVNLVDHGFQPVSFAYPFGSFDARAKGVVAGCGYTSGRGVSGVNDRKVFAETIPPLDAFATRTPPNPKQGTTVATIEGYVTAAEDNGGGWVQLVFHHVCDQCDAYSITQTDFTSLLAWLQSQGPGVSVETTAQVVGG